MTPFKQGLSTLWGEVNFPFTLAPMVGLSHVVLREVVRDYLPANAKTIWPTEMLNSRRLPHQAVGKTPETLFSERDELVVPQILGNEKEFIEKSIAKLGPLGIRGIDINMGCPVQKALKHNYGVALMGDAQYAASVVRMAKESTDLPVSVKLRVGLHKDEDHFYKFCHGLIENGADLLTLHPRTGAQKRRGNADWNQIKALKERVGVPIIGNGDVQTYKDAMRMLEETQCDGVMIGRALTCRPWILWQLGEEYGFEAPRGREGQRAPQGESEEAREYGVVVQRYCELCFQYFPYPFAMRKIKFFLRVSSPWLNFGHSLTKVLGKCRELEEFQAATQKFFESDSLILSPYTNLAY